MLAGVGVFNSDIVLIKAEAAAAYEVPAFIKHIIAAEYVRIIPIVVTVNGLYATTAEHPIHVGDFCRVETAHVQTGQVPDIAEHILHIGDFCRFEIAHVQAFQRLAIIEHVTHVCDFCRFETVQLNTGQFLAIIEHVFHVCDILRVQVFKTFNVGQVE